MSSITDGVEFGASGSGCVSWGSGSVVVSCLVDFFFVCFLGFWVSTVCSVNSFSLLSIIVWYLFFDVGNILK